jgi:hypothetical protein
MEGMMSIQQNTIGEFERHLIETTEITQHLRDVIEGVDRRIAMLALVDLLSELATAQIEEIE